MTLLDAPPVRNLLGAIFNSTPVSSSTEYVGSACYELRRSFGQHQNHTFVQVRDSELPEWIPEKLSFGPYERSILAQILYSASNVVIVRGGTGSGKSSLVEVLTKIASEAAVKSDWQNTVGARTFLAAIDLQVPGQSLTHPSTDDAQRQRQYNDLYELLADAFWRRFTTITTDETQVAVIRELWQQRVDHTDPVGNVASALLAFQEAVGLNEVDFEAAQAASLIKKCKAGVASIRSPETRLYISMLPFYRLGVLHKRLGDKRFVLVIDNLDPLPSYVQSKLWQTFNGFFCASLTKGCGLIAALFLRISSAHDPACTFTANVVADHAALDAADVVFYRTTYFLLNPTKFNGWLALHRSTQIALLNRLALLWCSLSNRESHASSVLNALSGTNLRNGFEYAIQWVQRVQFRDSQDQPVDDKHWTAISKTVLESLLGAKCDEIGRAIVEGLRVKMQATELKRVVLDNGPHKAGVHVGEFLIEIAWRCFVDLGVFKSQNECHLRSVVSKAIHDDEANLSQFKSSVASFGESAFGYGLSNLVLSNVSTIRSAALESAVIEGGTTPQEPEVEFVRGLAATVRSKFVRYCDSKAEEMGLETTALSSWKIVHFAQSLQDLETVIAESTKSQSDFQSIGQATRKSLSLTKRMQSLIGSYSRHDILAPLLNAEQSLSALALNLFTIDGRSICSAPLRILACLINNEYANQRSVASLSDDLHRHGYLESEMRGAITEMVRRDRRLIFSSTDDDFQGTDALVDDRNRPLNVSWSGYGHYRTLVRMPVYLQHCFLSLREVIDAADAVERKEPGNWGVRNGVVHRLATVLVGFELLVKDEAVRLKNLYESFLQDCDRNQEAAQARMRRQELSEESISLSIFFDSINDFMASLRRHALNVRNNGDSHELDLTKKLMARWIANGDSWLGVHATWFGTTGIGLGMWSASKVAAEKMLQDLGER